MNIFKILSVTVLLASAGLGAGCTPDRGTSDSNAGYSSSTTPPPTVNQDASGDTGSTSGGGMR